MSTKESEAASFLRQKTGGPLSLGKLISAIRAGEEQTQIEFAAILEISKSHLSDIELGRKFVSASRAAHFAKRLGYSQEQFIKLALQDELRREGLAFEVDIRRFPHRSPRKAPSPATKSNNRML